MTSESYALSEMSRTLLRMKAVPSNTVFCKQLITMRIPIVFRWFSSSSLTFPKAPTTIAITVALPFHNFCTCNLKAWYLVIFSSSLRLCLISRNSYVDDLAFSLLFISDYNILPLVFYFIICLDCKVPKDSPSARLKQIQFALNSLP